MSKPTISPLKKHKVKIAHVRYGLRVEKTVPADCGFFLSNSQGAYWYGTDFPQSRYQGFFFYNKDTRAMRKVIETIELLDATQKPLVKPLQIFHSGAEVKRVYKQCADGFKLLPAKNVMVYTVSKPTFIDITLDGKDSYDNREFGRYYDVSVQGNMCIIRFTKRTDNREDGNEGREEYYHYLAIMSDSKDCQKIGQWIAREYAADKERNSPPFLRHVYKALRLYGSRAVFSVGLEQEQVANECRQAFEQLEVKKGKKAPAYLPVPAEDSLRVLKNKNLSEQSKMAYICARHSLEGLLYKGSDGQNLLFAGLPWFFYMWSRDTLISLKALKLIDKNISQKLLEQLVGSIGHDGRLPTTIVWQNSVASADAIGWLIVRLLEEDTDKLKKNAVLCEKLKASLAALEQHYVRDGFYVCGPKESWMDTDWGGDNRAGSRIEHQALLLTWYKLMYLLTADVIYKNKEMLLQKRVRETFFNGTLLADGINDWTIRPNFVIAAYVYPELLSDLEWITVFEKSMPTLWLSWGGLASIDKNSTLFCAKSTGEKPQSYHRGDSWYFLNNMAALVMYRLCKKHARGKLKSHYKKIVQASTHEILWHGALGCHAEISDAQVLTSRGCVSQAWSAALFMELIFEMTEGSKK